MTLIFLSPTIQVDLLHHPHALFPLKIPGILTIPLGFAAGIVVSLLFPERAAFTGFDTVAALEPASMAWERKRSVSGRPSGVKPITR